MTTLPSAEGLLVTAYRARPTVTSLCGSRIATRLSGTYPAVRITLLGGPTRVVENTAQPELQVECWGNGSSTTAELEASDLALAVEAATPQLPGTYPAGIIAAAWVIGGILHLPDTSTTTVRERYILTVGITTQPL